MMMIVQPRPKVESNPAQLALEEVAEARPIALAHGAARPHVPPICTRATQFRKLDHWAEKHCSRMNCSHPWTRLLAFFQTAPIMGRMPLTGPSGRTALSRVTIAVSR
jgi:hypothetical protein